MKLQEMIDEMPLRAQIAVRLYAIRHPMSQKELAKRVNTKQPSLSRIENGKNLPRLSNLEKIVNTLGYKIIIRFKKHVKTKGK